MNLQQAALELLGNVEKRQVYRDFIRFLETCLPVEDSPPERAIHIEDTSLFSGTVRAATIRDMIEVFEDEIQQLNQHIDISQMAEVESGSNA